jgi:Tol biopolymer transport system component
MSSKSVIIHLFLFLAAVLYAFENVTGQQPVGVSNHSGTNLNKTQLFPALRGDSILFQTVKDGKPQICLLLQKENRQKILTLSGRHPVWVPGKQMAAFDTGSGKAVRLVLFDLKSGKKLALLRREMPCREVSFTPSRHLAVFSGYDDRTGRWQIFSYDFIYDNLNRLTTEKGNCRFPVFSPDGKSIVYTLYSDNGKTFLRRINWYGQDSATLAEGITGKACWTPDNWRVIFTAPYGAFFGLFTVRKDGSGLHLAKIFRNPISAPALSADGKTLWISVMKNGRYQIESLPWP